MNLVGYTPHTYAICVHCQRAPACEREAVSGRGRTKSRLRKDSSSWLYLRGKTAPHFRVFQVWASLQPKLLELAQI